MAKHNIVGYIACNPLVSQFDPGEYRVQMVVKIVDDVIVDQEFVTWLSTRNPMAFEGICKGLPVKAEVGRIVEHDGTSYFIDQTTGEQLPICKNRGFNDAITILERNHTVTETTDADKIRRNAGLMARSGLVQRAADLLAAFLPKKAESAQQTEKV